MSPAQRHAGHDREILARQYAPYWDIERARIGNTREVPAEVVVNGYSVAKQSLLADGILRDLNFEANVERSSWVAVRILGSLHTNSIFIIVGGKPVRATLRSAESCLKGVDQCWSQKESLVDARTRRCQAGV